MQVVNQLLDPRTSEFTAAFVGRLVSTLISRAGTELGEQLDQILRAILSKMQQAETLSVMQVMRGGGGGTQTKGTWLCGHHSCSCLSLHSPWSWCLLTWSTLSWSPCWSFCAVCLDPRGNLPWSLSWRSGWADSTCSMDSMREKSGQRTVLSTHSSTVGVPLKMSGPYKAHVMFRCSNRTWHRHKQCFT